MTERKRHIKLEGFYSNEDYRSRNTARTTPVPLRERTQHGNQLRQSFSQVLSQYCARRETAGDPISEELGIYVELISFSDIPLPLANLDNKDFKLHNLRVIGDIEKAVVFVPELRRNTFLTKVTQYLDVSKDGRNAPRNHNLIDSISDIRLAELSSFWTEDPSDYPRDKNVKVWWELWLKNVPGQDGQELVSQLVERLSLELANSSQTFFDCSVYLLKASVSELESAIELISSIKELRKAKEVPNPIVESNATDQAEWVEDILSRVEILDDISTSVVIFDYGVNYDNPLLEPFINQSYSEKWDVSWPDYDGYNRTASHLQHGSLQAGIAIYGDLLSLAISNESFVGSVKLESARVLPPVGINEPSLYGDITISTLSKLEVARPSWNRVYSIAVTATPEFLSGQPSSWSSQVDASAFNLGEELSRLFLISTGNNINIHLLNDHWEQAELAPIEDPAQSWNALTVGAYTELTTINEDGLENWSPLADSGDISPTTRSSTNWGWKKQAPYKPEIVVEGGNRIVSPDKLEISEADCVSLLTTSGRSSVQLFETTRDTSAATALASNYASRLMAEYPELWPETIRGLLVHSAKWTGKMYERFGLLLRDHSPKVAKETMLRTVGYGVPNLDRAQFSLANELTLISENVIRPFKKEHDAASSSDPRLNEMQLYQLPWPRDLLINLPPELDVKIKVTLSYFIEPNPSRRGYKQRYSYQSHALRFEVINPGQSLDNFKAKLNALMLNDEYDGPEGDSSGWHLGAALRKRGCVHSDVWTGSAQDLADMDTIAICPVGGWWKYKTAENRWMNDVRYSLLISLEVPDSNIDIYTEIENLIDTEVTIQT